MPIKISAVRSNYLKVEKSSVLLDTLLEDLVHPNPDYLAEIRFTYSKTSRHPETLQFFEETPTHYLLPRNYKRGLELSLYRKVKDNSTIGLPLGKEIVCHIRLRDYQEKYLRRVREEDQPDCVLNVPCGHGKTVLALSLIAYRNVRTIIFVPTNFLADQWAARIEEFLGCSYLRVTPTTKADALAKADVVVITYELFNSRKDQYAKAGLIETFGQVIIDEAHRTGAPTYYPIVNLFSARYRVALSATFRRRDGLHAVLSYVFGKVYAMKSVFPKPHTYLWDFGLADEEEGFDGLNAVAKVDPATYRKTLPALSEVFSNHLYFSGLIGVCNLYEDTRRTFSFSYTKDEATVIKRVYASLDNVNYANLDTFTSEVPYYKSWVFRTVRNVMLKGRRPLLLSKRVSLLKETAEYLISYGFKKEEICVVTGKANKFAFSSDVTKARCVLGIVQLAQEGLDVDFLDTLILAHPIKDIEQAYGRIRRFVPGKPHPVVIQPYNWSIYYNRLQQFSSTVFKENSEPPVTIKTLSDVV